MTCLGCGASSPSSPCEACLDAEAALESFFRSRGMRASTTHPVVRADEVQGAEVTRLRAELAEVTRERDSLREVLAGMHEYNARLVRALEGL